MDSISKTNLLNDGFAVLPKAFSNSDVIEEARRALCAWHETPRDLDSDSVRYGHCPEFFDTDAGTVLLDHLYATAADILGEGNVDRSIPPQLLAYVEGKIPSPRQAKRHIDNIPNCLKLRERLASEKGIPLEDEPIPYPGFNCIIGAFLTPGRLRICPQSHLKVAAYYATSDDMEAMIRTVSREIVDALDNETVIECEQGDIVIMNHLLAHAACDSPQAEDSNWVVPSRNVPLASRCYIRAKSIDPTPPGLALMRDPWFGCRGLQ